MPEVSFSFPSAINTENFSVGVDVAELTEFAGISLLLGCADSIGVMITLVDFTDFPDSIVHVLKFDGSWTLVSTLTAPGDSLPVGADGGFSATPSYAVKTAAGNYILSLDEFADTYPFTNFISSDGGVTWEPFFEDEFFANATGQTADGAIWGFRDDGFFKIYRDEVLKYTSPEADVNWYLSHIAVHPTNSDIIAVAGIREVDLPGPDDQHPLVISTIDGGATWEESVLADNRMSFNSSFEHLNLIFLPSGRLVYLTMHETRAIQGEMGPDGLRIWYADAPYSSWTEVNESTLWDLGGDDDWEGGPTTGGLVGVDEGLFFLGNSTVELTNDSHVFMSTDSAETWVELEEPPRELTGIYYDHVSNVLYGLESDIDLTGTILMRMIDPISGSGTWEDVTTGIPIAINADTFPFTQQAIWGV